MEKNSVELMDIKQRFLFNGLDKYTQDIIKILQDEVLNSIGFEKDQRSNNEAKFGINVLANKDDRKLLLEVVFIYNYIGNSKKGRVNFSTIGRFDAVVRVVNELDGKGALESFVNQNMLILVEPIMNYISKTLIEMTADTLEFPKGINVYNDFKKQYEKSDGKFIEKI